MLPYESKPVQPPEAAWKLVASICMSGLACLVGLMLWWQTTPGLWTLATFTPRGPVRPMGLVAGLFIFMIAGAISIVFLAMPAASMSKRRPAQIVAASMLPLMNFLLFFVIVFARRIELGG